MARQSDYRNQGGVHILDLVIVKRLDAALMLIKKAK
jgi:hypothetical protein